MKVLSFGSLNLDYMYQVDAIVRPGETIASSALDIHCGGKGLNQSVALCKAGAEVWHAGKVGEDGGMLLSCLEDAGVHTELVKTDKNVRTGHAIIQIAKGSGQNSIIICAGANRKIDEAFIRDVVSHFDAGDYAVFQNEISNVEYAMQCCREKGMHVVFNPSPLTKELIQSDVYRYVDELFVNETEGQMLAGTDDPEEICRILKERWPNCRTILTLGSDGAMILEEGKFIRQKAFLCKAVDTTGAGDTFSGFFVAMCAAGKNSREALELASKASSLAVRKPGAAEAVPTLREVLEAEF